MADAKLLSKQYHGILKEGNWQQLNVQERLPLVKKIQSGVKFFSYIIIMFNVILRLI